MEEIQFLRVCFCDMKIDKMTVRQAEDNSRILHVEIYSNFEKKVVSAVLIILLSDTTGKIQCYLKASIKSWSSCWNSAKLAYKTLVWGVKKTMGELGKENEKVLFIAKEKNQYYMMLQSYRSSKSLHFRLQPTSTVISVRPNFPHWHTISQLPLSVFLWEFMTFGIYYTADTQYSYTLISWISTSQNSFFSCSPVFRFSVGVTHGRFTNPAPAKAWLL